MSFRYMDYLDELRDIRASRLRLARLVCSDNGGHLIGCAWVRLPDAACDCGSDEARRIVREEG